MKDKPLKDLIEKYNEAHSSIDEETLLHKRIDASSDPAINSWSKFVNTHKVKAPGQFNDKQWENFETKTNSTRKLLIGSISAAASVLLILALYLYHNNSQQKMSYEEKAALLNEAIEMASNQEDNIANQDIIYEDNTIIIYIKQN